MKTLLTLVALFITTSLYSQQISPFEEFRPIPVDNYTTQEKRQDILMSSMVIGSFVIVQAIDGMVTPKQRGYVFGACLAVTTFTFIKISF